MIYSLVLDTEATPEETLAISYLKFCEIELQTKIVADEAIAIINGERLLQKFTLPARAK